MSTAAAPSTNAASGSKKIKKSDAMPKTAFQNAIDPARRFAMDSYRLIQKCTKPDAKEFKKIAVATTVGFLVMGFIGFFVKLIHIPINNIIVGA